MTDRISTINLSGCTFEQLEDAFSVLACISELPELLDELCADLHEECERRVQLRRVEEGLS